MYKVSVPGSLMLFGEHAVLHDKLAIAAAVDKKITANLTLRTDNVINITSSLGMLQTNLESLEINNQLRFVTTAIKHQIKNLSISKGFDLYIESDFSAQVGLGSSAASTIATLALLELAYKSVKIDLMELFFLARRIIREVQGIGSGADVAASIFGGVISYKMSSAIIEKIADTLPLAIIYCGYKLATPLVVAKVKDLYGRYPNIFSLVFDAIEHCVIEAVKQIKEKNWQNLGELMNIHQGLQDALGVNDANLAKLIFSLREQPNIFGAKISGSGLGDCVIGLGDVTSDFSLNQIDVSIASGGIIVMSN